VVVDFGFIGFEGEGTFGGEHVTVDGEDEDGGELGEEGEGGGDGEMGEGGGGAGGTEEADVVRSCHGRWR